VWMLRSGVTVLRHGANGFIQLLRAVPLLARALRYPAGVASVIRRGMT